ncbi:MAG TPA: hypothetical protein VE263_12995 [Candidatus Angelobacter sp.]|nr:hypothetical protein [Candidatus Angelobacter sp.]
MDADSVHLLLYAVAKFIAYTVWCAVGIGLLWSLERAANVQLAAAAGTSSQRKWLLAAGYGFLRLLMGIFFGILIWILGTMLAVNIVNAPHRDVITYLAVYVPVRWVEWTILAWIIARNSANRIGYGWRFGGIAISCLADIPLIAATGWMLPIGRFFC